MKIPPTILALAAAVAIPAVAQAETIRVEYKDLDLTTKAGQDELDRRLQRAARGVCGIDDVRSGTRMPSLSASRCLRNARIDLDRQFAAVIEGQPKGG